VYGWDKVYHKELICYKNPLKFQKKFKAIKISKNIKPLNFKKFKTVEFSNYKTVKISKTQKIVNLKNPVRFVS